MSYIKLILKIDVGNISIKLIHMNVYLILEILFLNYNKLHILILIYIYLFLQKVKKDQIKRLYKFY